MPSALLSRQVSIHCVASTKCRSQPLCRCAWAVRTSRKQRWPSGWDRTICRTQSCSAWAKRTWPSHVPEVAACRKPPLWAVDAASINQIARLGRFAPERRRNETMQEKTEGGSQERASSTRRRWGKWWKCASLQRRMEGRKERTNERTNECTNELTN